MFLQVILFCMLMNSSKDDTMNLNYETMNERQYSWLALGDSYTIGESVNENERFPAQTITLLKAESLNFSEPHYIATTGWTTENLLDGIEQRKQDGPFDIVSLLIGVNDQYQHMDTADYRKHFNECLEKAIGFAGDKKNRVFVLSIPDYSVTPFAANSDITQIRTEIDEFNAINKAITLSYDISYIDITPLTREAENDTSLIAADGLHPSAKEYAKWAELLATEIKAVLE